MASVIGTIPPRWFLAGAAGLMALVAFALVAVVPGTAGINDNVAWAHTPPCPSSLPTEDGESFFTDSQGDEWFIIRQTSSSGHTTVQAYVKSDSYSSGYVPSSPHETCNLKVRGPDDDADLDPPVQIFFSDDDDDDDSSATGTGTGTSQDPSATFSLTESSDSTGLASVGLAWFVYQAPRLRLPLP